MCEFCKPFIINALRVWHTVGYILFKPTTQKQTLKPNLNLIVAQTMKKITKYLTATALIIVAATPGSYAQATATASATGNIITPITISLVTSMNFGNIAVSPTSGGTVVLSASAGTRTSTGGVTLPATAGTVTAANFTVSGASGYTYAITLPSSATITDGSSHTMSLGTFTSYPSGTGVLTGGSQTLKVGATLTVTAAQAPNAYTNSTAVPVTVNYN